MVTVGACLMLLAGQAAPAMADTSTAGAQAASLTLPGGPVTTPVSAASNSGEQQTQTSGAAPGLGLLGEQTLISAGALVQRAVAYPDGTSVACAGLVGNGGTITVGKDGSCDVSGGGIEINLRGLATVKADAIIASCRAVAGAAPVARASLANASVLLLGLPLRDLSLSAGPNTVVDIPGVATLLLDARSAPSGAGSIRSTALRISLRGTAVAADVGIAGCGRNAVITPVPALAAHTLPVVGAALAAALWLGRHRLRTLVRATPR
ncbi:choice-of-anchor P family protein [Catenuloplanes indicus]|uniref:Uncharacterized protein n=1 Tax=Catenuloplanes indicus TaxID=137267 RepID=A0AAE3VWP9_9ACTN|nr:choice-of-anchor P family protein [Catenuloplanes indicus]MDQ0364672.1 hypothetical protein [Catenuloplanes indicus]